VFLRKIRVSENSLCKVVCKSVTEEELANSIYCANCCSAVYILSELVKLA